MSVKPREDHANRIELRNREGQAIEWWVDKWGRGQVESFIEISRECSAGDRLQFARNAAALAGSMALPQP